MNRFLAYSAVLLGALTSLSASPAQEGSPIVVLGPNIYETPRDLWEDLRQVDP